MQSTRDLARAFLVQAALMAELSKQGGSVINKGVDSPFANLVIFLPFTALMRDFIWLYDVFLSLYALYMYTSDFITC
jgi:hypothetical protein